MLLYISLICIYSLLVFKQQRIRAETIYAESVGAQHQSAIVYLLLHVRVRLTVVACHHSTFFYHEMTVYARPFTH